MVVGVQQYLHRYIDSLLGAREAEQVLRFHRIVGPRDLRAQRRRAESLGVAETDALEVRAILRRGERKKLLERHVFAVGSSQVVFGGEFPLREIDFESEISHRLRLYDMSPDVLRVRASAPIRRTSRCG